MPLHTDIRGQIKEAMLAKDTLRLEVLRGLITAFTNDLVAKRRKPDEILSDEASLAVIAKEARKRKESIELFAKGGRQDLVDKEKAELAILETYLPEQMPYEDVLAYVKEKYTELGISPAADAAARGKFMGSIMKDLKGKADGSTVKQAIDSLFK